MATGGGFGRKDEDFRYTCTLCMEPYYGRSPKFLPCYHCFCLPCLTALEASVTTATTLEAAKSEDEAKDKSADAEGYAKWEDEDSDSTAPGLKVDSGARQADSASDQKTFLCPACRAPVTVPEGGVAFLQSNFYVDQEPETEYPPLCDMCEEGNQQSATHVCQDCRMNVCRACRRHHDMLTRDHHVTAIGPSQAGKEREGRRGVCMVHRDQVLCFHCRQCQVSICLHCKFSSHEGHDTVELSRAALAAREEMASLVTSAQQQVHTMQTSLRSLDRKELQLTRHAQEATQKVHARFEQLVTWGRKSRDRLLDAVSWREDADRGQILTEKSATTTVVNALSSLVSRAVTAQSAGNDLDVVSLRNELKAALLSDDMLERHRQQAASQDTAWSWRYDDQSGAATSLQAADVQAYMGTLEDEGDTTTTAADQATKHVSLQDLVARVDRFVADANAKMSALTDKEADVEKKMTSLGDELTSVKKEATDQKEKRTSLSDELTKAKREIASLVDNVTSLKSEATDQKEKITSLGDELTKAKSETASIVDNVKSLKKDQNEKLESLREKIDKGVSFVATGIDKDRTFYGSRLLFSKVENNAGNGYDVTTGLFTASVPGTYVFSATVGCRVEKRTVRAELHVNGTMCTELGGSYESTGSASVCIWLKAGDTVFVKASSPAERYYFKETSFAGALVQPQL